MQNLDKTVLYSWLASCAKGLESLLAQEIRELGGEIEKETHLGVHWKGDLECAYRVCLWSRLASRLLLPLQESQVSNVDEMYEQTRQLDWNQVFSPRASLRIDFYGRTDYINNTQFGAQKIKDAIVDRFRLDTGSRPMVDKQADVRIEARLAKGKLGLYYNFSGSGMHRRGYRLQPGSAPLKETLAAALLTRSGWPTMMKEGKHLVDPMCGSGTLVIEAAMMAADVAPGLNRQQHGFEHWRDHDRKLWMSLVEEARQRRTNGIEALTNRFYGLDIDNDQLTAAYANLTRSGLEGKVHLERRPVVDLRVQKQVVAEGGLIICNPPYGERLSELPQLVPLYQELQRSALSLPDWPLAVFTGNTDLARAIRRPLHKQYGFMNGAIETRLLVFNAADERSFRAAEESAQQPAAIRGPVEAFANRLKKNLKPLQKWASKENISCYRIYDQDIPEYAVAIDWYQSVEGEPWLHVQEYVPPKSVDPQKSERRLLDLLAALPVVTAVPSQQIVLKRRERQSGKKQYERNAVRDDVQAFQFPVREGQVRLKVNLKDYLDTGLFLDHRPTRLDIAQRAGQQPGMRFLNLFCYTATASVHAAAAGASCTSVDMSRTYLNWGKDNFELNQLALNGHEFIQADCIKWLQESQHSVQRDLRQKYDLIFMDPPSFSNSKRMESVLDIQRDHVALIQQAVALLKPEGTLIFSTNLRKFVLDEAALKAADQPLVVTNMSRQSVPKDFARRSNIHQCFYVRVAPI